MSFQYEDNSLKRKLELSQQSQGMKEDELMALMGKFKSNQATESVPKIIYASRTHSQISQALQELKRSGYGNMKAAVIGSRDQLCINSEVLKETTNAGKV